ncbi:hypothetical protein HPB47_012237 [Ixodes persulcatus]|uniref:Uncharacterized protein n=1 Tax=Ixodes persulcatus TaxID=34615 RepID=A0AC60NU12_IXOPE|nr:hypothetical protein HPB47_012237 [Ixodes persulcatus]
MAGRARSIEHAEDKVGNGRADQRCRWQGYANARVARSRGSPTSRPRGKSSSSGIRRRRAHFGVPTVFVDRGIHERHGATDVGRPRIPLLDPTQRRGTGEQTPEVSAGVVGAERGVTSAQGVPGCDPSCRRVLGQ